MTAALIIVAWWCLLIVAWSLCRAAAAGDRYLPPEAPVDPSLPSEGRPAPLSLPSRAFGPVRVHGEPTQAEMNVVVLADVIAAPRNAAAAPDHPDAAA